VACLGQLQKGRMPSCPPRKFLHHGKSPETAWASDDSRTYSFTCLPAGVVGAPCGCWVIRISVSSISRQEGVPPVCLAFESTGGLLVVAGTFQPGKSWHTNHIKHPCRSAALIGAAGPLTLLIAAWPSLVAANLSQSISGW
jgi:hypothetical protein